MITREDIFILAQTVWGEGRGESYEAKKAIAHVVINRTDKKVGDRDHSIAATALRHYQFSAWLENDPNREKMQSVDVDDKYFRDSLRASLEAIDEEDFTKGATHYHTASIMPNWAKGHHPSLRLGHHLFYNDVK